MSLKKGFTYSDCMDQTDAFRCLSLWVRLGLEAKFGKNWEEVSRKYLAKYIVTKWRTVLTTVSKTPLRNWKNDWVWYWNQLFLPWFYLIDMKRRFDLLSRYELVGIEISKQTLIPEIGRNWVRIRLWLDQKFTLTTKKKFRANLS